MCVRERETDRQRRERVLKEVHGCRLYIIVYFKILLGIWINFIMHQINFNITKYFSKIFKIF